MSDLDALVTRLVTAGSSRVYKFGNVPSKPSYPYVVLSPAPGAPVVRTLDGSGDPLGRFTVQHFARTAEELATATERTFYAFDAVELTELPGKPVAWQEVATPPYRDPDTSGVLNSTHTYRY